MLLKSVTGIIILCLSPVLYCQYLTPDRQREFVDQQIESLLMESDSVYGKDIRLLNGRIYFPSNQIANGHPYFISPDWINGTVTLYGKTFAGVKLNYDIYKDNLVYLYESSGGMKIRILLNKNQVATFTLGDHTFTVHDFPAGNYITEKQYFEVLFKGKVSLFNKKTKKFEAVATRDNPYGKYADAKITRYVLKEDRFYKINNKSSLLKVFYDKEYEIKKYIRKNKIHVRRASDQEMTELFEYYNNIISDN